MRYAHEAAAGRIGFRPDDMTGRAEPGLRPGMHEIIQLARARRMGSSGDGAALCAPDRGASRGLRRPCGHHGHELVTACWSLNTALIVSPRNTGIFRVARGGIEPPMRGFSVRVSAYLNFVATAQ